MFKRQESKFRNVIKVSDTLEDIGKKSSDGKTTIIELVEEFRENGLILAMIFFSLPVAIPLPYPPGFTTIMGTPLIILSFQMLMGYHKVKLPKKINNYEIKNSIIIMICNKVVPFLRILEKYLKPRMRFTGSLYCEQLIGFLSLLCAVAIAIPLPFTNAIPALSIAVMGLGFVGRDGLVVIIGFVIGIIGLIIATGAIIGSWISIKYLYNLLF